MTKKYIIIFVIVLLFPFGYFLLSKDKTLEPSNTFPVLETTISPKTPIEKSQKKYVTVDDVIIPVDISDTDRLREKGLSGRLSLAPNEGMFFIFPKEHRYSFWMPDMHFPIDMVWITDGKIVDITANVSNEFDPHNPKYYRPKVPVKYVLEVNAGFMERHGLGIGDSVNLEGLK